MKKQLIRKGDGILPPKLFSPSQLQSVLAGQNAIGFSIPIYQRLYAWTEKEINTLLNDFKNAFDNQRKNDNRKDKDYFLGNLTLYYNNSSGCYDLIDGQQRMTTLWLIGLVFMKESSDNVDWQNFITNKDILTLKFIARDSDNNFLSCLLKESSLNEESIGDLVAKDVQCNTAMILAIKCIKLFLENLGTTPIDGFSRFVFEKVKMGAIFLSRTVEFNKYFEDMNNRGLQLEHHHIIKAYFLNNVKDVRQESYGRVWDAVSQMNQYIEYGLKGTLKENREVIHSRVYDSFFIKSNEEAIQDKNKTELRLLIEEAITSNPEKEKKKEEEGEDKVTSIINFPQFLILCLKIFTGDETISYDDKKLVEIFDNANKYKEAENFIKFLLDARIIFDSHFIKSVRTGDFNVWQIRDVRINDHDKEFVRKQHLEGEVVQLQSMLNASFSANSWLTIAIRYFFKIEKGHISINENGKYDREDEKSEISELAFIEALKRIDRGRSTDLVPLADLCRGTATSRYWFFKLDYLLWKKWAKESKDVPDFSEIPDLLQKMKQFQFRDNRSIEHVQPQNPEEGKDWEVPEGNVGPLSDIKNQFGNLSLISVRSNSSYNNQVPALKKDDFIKRSKNWGIESLKLLHIYSYPDWNIENMKLHEKEMYAILEEDYNRVF